MLQTRLNTGFEALCHYHLFSYMAIICFRRNYHCTDDITCTVITIHLKQMIENVLTKTNLSFIIDDK